ncbi:MAG: NAD(P)/FAD-dependent oxidoreductase [Reichenbachiella sp.]|uniref:NAD(P)/FAD-dependent oxidoreductase n=1 Tax=Reichenbachiella sp. TaxID=2184521 RepID=UPI0032993063
MNIAKKRAIIIGAGPAGLTAGYELLKNTDIVPIVYEASSDIGGISKTVNYKGNRIDIGGHRFFSKSDRVMNWWTDMMPVEENNDENIEISYQNKKRKVVLETNRPNPHQSDVVMLIRSRLSRIFYLRSFFSYPISLSFDTVLNLGVFRMVKILIGYVIAILKPIKPEQTLEDFLINRFGKELYLTFFKDYTEKVWGTPCDNISSEWGAQRIKGLSITKTVIHAIKTIIQKDNSIDQKSTETSLIEKFFYPKYGPGQMWELTAEKIKKMGGELHIGHQIVSMNISSENVKTVTVLNIKTNEKEVVEGDYFFSTMPVKELIGSIERDIVPSDVQEVAEGLQYRDFITVGLLLDKLHIKTRRGKNIQSMVKDNWIYIQEPDVKVGRLQIFNNWSPYMVESKDKVWIGLEYFCNEGDELWTKKDKDFIQFGIEELVKIDFIKSEDVLDSTIIRMPKTYPAYFGSYKDFEKVIEFTKQISNLFLIGRNGMHKYNNQDHSMLTAMVAVENIVNGEIAKDNIWAVNTEVEYHEEGNS